MDKQEPVAIPAEDKCAPDWPRCTGRAMGGHCTCPRPADDGLAAVATTALRFALGNGVIDYAEMAAILTALRAQSDAEVEREGQEILTIARKIEFCLRPMNGGEPNAAGAWRYALALLGVLERGEHRKDGV